MAADGTFTPAGPVDFDLSERTYPGYATPTGLNAAGYSPDEVARHEARDIAGGSDDDEAPSLGGRALSSANDALRFILAGNATITLKSLKTGAHFTYKVQEPQKKDPSRPVWFVKLLTGPDNTGDYTYLGMITSSPLGSGVLAPIRPTFNATKATRNPEATSFKAFAYTFAALAGGTAPAGVEIRHEGRCGRCGRALTVPESIDRGIGPECAERMGV
jgi:hypothetical protein